MAKSVTMLKDLLRREEAHLKKLNATIKEIVHDESKAVLKDLQKAKKSAISSYKKIIKQSEKCPAIVKKAVSKARKTVAKKKAAVKKAAKKKVARKGAAKKKTAAKKTAKKKTTRKAATKKRK